MPSAWRLIAAALTLASACGGPARRPITTPPAVPVAADTIRIGAWNLKRLGHGEKRLDVVAEVIDHEMDVVALEEVMEPGVVQELVGSLPGWQAVVSPDAVGQNGYEEHYAVLYRADRVSVTKSFTMDDPRDELAREPFVACLKAGAFDACVVAFHAVYGKGGVKLRDDEIEALGLLVMDLKAAGPEKDWIVVGDFNRPHTAPGFGVLTDGGWACALGAAPTPTTLGMKAYGKPYDHVLVDAGATGELRGGAVRYDLVAGPCNDDFGWCRDEVSDHAPVIARFSTAGPDDD